MLFALANSLALPSDRRMRRSDGRFFCTVDQAARSLHRSSSSTIETERAGSLLHGCFGLQRPSGTSDRFRINKSTDQPINATMFPFWIELPAVSLMHWLPFAAGGLTLLLASGAGRGSCA